jgi:hypothetical protein
LAVHATREPTMKAREIIAVLAFSHSEAGEVGYG